MGFSSPSTNPFMGFQPLFLQITDSKDDTMYFVLFKSVHNLVFIFAFHFFKSCSKTLDQEKPISEGWFVAEEAVVLQYE